MRAIAVNSVFPLAAIAITLTGFLANHFFKEKNIYNPPTKQQSGTGNLEAKIPNFLFRSIRCA
jgi:hypothetical protein